MELEYSIVDWDRKKLSYELKDELNQMARSGWRLVAVVPHTGNLVRHYFERQKRPKVVFDPEQGKEKQEPCEARS